MTFSDSDTVMDRPGQALPEELTRTPRRSDPVKELGEIFPGSNPTPCHFADESGINSDRTWVAIPAFGAAKHYPQLRVDPKTEAHRAAAVMKLIMGDEIPVQIVSCLPLDIQPPDEEERAEVKRGEKDVSMVSLSVGGQPDKPWYIAMDEEALRMHPEALDALKAPWEHHLGYGLKEKFQEMHPDIKNPDTQAPDAATKYLSACADMIGNRLAGQIMQGAEMPAWLEFQGKMPATEIEAKSAEKEQGMKSAKPQKRMQKTHGMAARNAPTSTTRITGAVGDYSSTISF